MTQRSEITRCLHDACSHHPRWGSVDVDLQNKIIMLLERSCLNESVAYATKNNVSALFENSKFIEIYSSISAKLVSNIDVNSAVASEYLLTEIIERRIQPVYAAALSSREMCPHASSAEVDEIHRRLGQKHTRSLSKLHICKCGSRDVDMTERQTRSADELPTFTITCHTCSRSWRIQ